MSTIPKIIWPAPGSPALLQEDQSLALLVAADQNTSWDEIRTWARSIALRDPRGETIGLEIVGIDAADRREVESLAASLAELPETARWSWSRVRMRLQRSVAVPAPRTAVVLDLVRDGEVLRPNAVGMLSPNRSRLVVAFASDLHVARIWDTLEQAIERHAPDLTARFLHPVRSVERFVAMMNAKAASGELDLVVFGGDLVDHVHPTERGSGSRGEQDSNVRRFLDVASRLEVPAVMLSGNHDYRPFPWRPRLPSLDVVALPAHRMRPVLRAAGLWDRWPLLPSDLAALQTQEEDGSPGLRHHLNLLSPVTELVLEARGLRMIFANTGRDILPRWRELEWPRRRLLPRTLLSSWEHPDSEGFEDVQIARMRDAFTTARGAALFFHAPLLHTGHPVPVEQRVDRLDPGDGDGARARLEFERRLLRAGVRRGVFFRNPAPFVRTLLSAPCPVTVLSGHVHRGSAVALDRRSLRVRSTPMEAPASPTETIGIYTAPALGQMRHIPAESQPPGFLLAAFEDGRLQSLEQRAVSLP